MDLGIGPAQYDDGRSLLRHRHGNGPAQPSARAGDDRDPVPQLHRAPYSHTIFSGRPMTLFPMNPVPPVIGAFMKGPDEGYSLQRTSLTAFKFDEIVKSKFSH